MSKLTVYKVSWISPFINHVFSDLFISPLEAKVFFEKKKEEGAVDIKLFKVTDIWNTQQDIF